METIQYYINAARVLLQDTTGAPRYKDETFQLAMDFAFDEARRLRPDMFIRRTVPTFLGGALTLEVPIPDGYRMSFVYYLCGYVQLQDQEDTTDARASAMMGKFTAQLMMTAA